MSDPKEYDDRTGLNNDARGVETIPYTAPEPEPDGGLAKDGYYIIYTPPKE